MPPQPSTTATPPPLKWTCIPTDATLTSFTPTRIAVQSGAFECMPRPTADAAGRPANTTSGCIVLASLNDCRMWLLTQASTVLSTTSVPILSSVSPSTSTFTNSTADNATASQRAVWVLLGVMMTLAVLCMIVLARRWLLRTSLPLKVPSYLQSRGSSSPLHTIVEPTVVLGPCTRPQRRGPPKPSLHVARQVECWAIDPRALRTTKLLYLGTHCVIHEGKYKDDVVAVKSLQPSSTRNVQSFADEIKLHCSVESPYLLHAIGVRVRDLHLVLEFMDLGDVQSHLHLKTPHAASWKGKLKCARAAAHALAHLHGLHIVHRHVKSRHILLHSSGRAVLGGLGSAESALTGAAALPSQPAFRWMAPEVVVSQSPHTPAADMFSLGVVLWELDSHDTPYAKEQRQFGWGDVHLMQQIQTQAVTLTFSPNCPAGVVNLAKKCLSTDPSRRPTASEAVEILRQPGLATSFDAVPTLH